MEDLQNLMPEGLDNDPSTMSEDGFGHDVTGETVPQSQVNSGLDTSQTVLSEEQKQPGFGSKLDSDELEFDSGVEEFLNSDNVLKSSVI